MKELGAIGLHTHTGRMSVYYDPQHEGLAVYCVQDVGEFEQVLLVLDPGHVQLLRDFLSGPRVMLLRKDFAAWFWKTHPGKQGTYMDESVLEALWSDFRQDQARRKVEQWRKEQGAACGRIL